MSIGSTVKLSGAVVLNFYIIVKYHPSFPLLYAYCLLSFSNLSSIRNKAWFCLAQNFQLSVSKTFEFVFRKNELFLESIFFHKYRKKLLSIFVKSLRNKHEHELFHKYFSGFFFFLTFQEHVFKEHI